MSVSPPSGSYEVVFLPSGPNDRLPLLFAFDDEDAVQIALIVRDHREMQVWCGPRLVAAFPARSHVEMLVETSGHALPLSLSPTSHNIH